MTPVNSAATSVDPATYRDIALAASRLGVDLNDRQIEQLLAFVDLLMRWNRIYNLTAVRDPAAMRVQHVYDCLATVTPLRRELGGSLHRRLLDVGSGGGLPGIVVAIAVPDVEVICVDSVGKKAAFIAQVAGSLALTNLSARHSKVEDIRSGDFDVVASRAFSSLAQFVSVSDEALSPDGRWMAMKGREPVSELAELDASSLVFHVEPLQVPSLDAERCLVWIHRASQSGRTLASKTLPVVA